MQEKKAIELSEYIDWSASRIAEKAKSVRCDSFEWTGLDYGYSIKVVIRKNKPKKKVKAKINAKLPEWYLKLSGKLYVLGADPHLQTMIPNAFLRAGYSSLEDVEKYCELVEYGKNMKNRLNTKYGSYPPRNIGKKSFEWLRKVFEDD